MIFAQIKNKFVVNIIELEDEELIPLFSSGFDYMIRIDLFDPIPGIGCKYENNIFIFPETSGELKNVTPRQMRQALILYGIYDLIAPALASLSEPTKSLAEVEWEYSIAFERNRPLVSQVGAMLGWTDEQLDALWRFAATL